ncbi:MAG: hypothetical protein EHM35_20320 [Planctomycetaceae bacterium]|nr:MAG: hypothetical protein EHM35_20320 [Planctomycetaceae bacterium]
MKRLALLLLTAMAALAAEDSWVQVQELKSGTDLRIYRVNVKEPLLAKFDQASDESLIVIIKNGQVSIPKEQIDRLDCRRTPPNRLVKETRTDRKIARKGAEISNNTIPGATTSVKTRLEIPSKSAFEKIYNRTPAGK